MKQNLIPDNNNLEKGEEEKEVEKGENNTDDCQNNISK